RAVPWGGADLAVLDSGNFGIAAFEDVGDLVDGFAGGFAEAGEFDAEAAALDPVTWAGWHGAPPGGRSVCLVTIAALASMCSCGMRSQSAVASNIANRHST